jgi:hypothetical protein
MSRWLLRFTQGTTLVFVIFIGLSSASFWRFNGAEALGSYPDPITPEIALAYALGPEGPLSGWAMNVVLSFTLYKQGAGGTSPENPATYNNPCNPDIYRFYQGKGPLWEHPYPAL